MEKRETKGNIGWHPDTECTELDDDEEQESLQTTDILNSPETSKETACQPFTQQNPTSSNVIPSSSALVFAKPTRVSGGKKNAQPETAASTLMKYLLEKKEEETKSSTSGLPTVTLDNPIDCFLFGISPTLKSLPPYLQNFAKTEIFSTVQKFELQTMRSSYSRDSRQLETIEDTSSSQDTESAKEYWENFIS